MARCDLCGQNCKAEEMVKLLSQYQINGVADICPDCRKWADGVKGKLLDEVSVKMREAIAERAGAPTKTKWQTIVGWFK